MEEGISIHLAPLALFHIGDFAVTNTFFTTLVVSALLIIFAFFAGRSLRLKPSKFGAVVEALVMLPYQFVRDTLENDAVTRRVFPIIMTIFVFVLAQNWFGLLPFTEGIGIITHDSHGKLVSFFHSAATDLNFTLMLAFVAFFVIEIAGIATLGAFRYGKKFISFASPLAFSIGLIELISELARIVSFSFRLFGNVFAGKTLIIVAGFFVPLFLPVPIMAFELFVGFIQAAIFALLTLFFVKIAISSHDEHAEESSGEGMPHSVRT